MVIDHSSAPAQKAWEERTVQHLAAILKSGRFERANNSIPERALALATGLMREARGRSKNGMKYQFRIELCCEKERARTLFGEETEWLTVSQISQLEGISRRASLREYQATAARLFAHRDAMWIHQGEIHYSTDLLTSEERTRFEEHREARSPSVQNCNEL